jgi:hypothetical protein
VQIPIYPSDVDLPPLEKSLLNAKTFSSIVLGNNDRTDERYIDPKLNNMLFSTESLQLVGLSRSAQYLELFVRGKADKKHILEAILPIYVSTTIFDDTKDYLKPPLVPFENICEVLNMLKQRLSNECCGQSGTSVCGKNAGCQHMRATFGHPRVCDLVEWIWDSLGCFYVYEQCESVDDF